MKKNKKKKEEKNDYFYLYRMRKKKKKLRKPVRMSEKNAAHFFLEDANLAGIEIRHRILTWTHKKERTEKENKNIRIFSKTQTNIPF